MNRQSFSSDEKGNNKIVIESLSMDLLRVALGYHKGSLGMAKRFSEEALRRSAEVEKSKIKPYFSKILNKVSLMLREVNHDRIAEDALMYSIICKNYAKKFL